MMENGRLRERQIWIAAVAVLVTSLSWLALVNGVLLMNRLEIAPRLVLVLKALFHVVLGVARAFAPLAVLGALMALFVGWIVASARSGAREPGARHV